VKQTLKERVEGPAQKTEPSNGSTTLQSHNFRAMPWMVCTLKLTVATVEFRHL
jgi:hypothetical protein